MKEKLILLLFTLSTITSIIQWNTMLTFKAQIQSEQLKNKITQNSRITHPIYITPIEIQE